MNTQEISLDLSKRPNAVELVMLGQGDRQGTTLRATIYDNGTLLDSTGLTSYFVMRLPDRKHYYRKLASLESGVATVTIDEMEAASIAGQTDDAYFQILSGDTVIASTSRFCIRILRSALEGTTKPESFDESIDKALSAAERASTAADSATEATDAANAATEAAIDATRDAITATASAEAATARATSVTDGAESAERARVAAESARVTAEQGRASAESARVTAENARQAASTSATNAANAAAQSANSAASAANTARQLTEAATAEATAIANRSKQVADDTVAAEAARVIAENARVAAETSRASAESARDGAEQARASAETERQAASASAVGAANTAATNAQAVADDLTAAKARGDFDAEVADVTVEVGQTIGEASAEVTLGGRPGAQTFNFVFDGVKGEPGDTHSFAIHKDGQTITLAGTDASTSSVTLTNADIIALLGYVPQPSVASIYSWRRWDELDVATWADLLD